MCYVHPVSSAVGANMHHKLCAHCGGHHTKAQTAVVVLERTQAHEIQYERTLHEVVVRGRGVVCVFARLFYTHSSGGFPLRFTTRHHANSHSAASTIKFCEQHRALQAP